jgi:lipopolysaccharide transport system ATP-binding protein
MGRVVVADVSKRFAYKAPRHDPLVRVVGSDARISSKRREFWALRDIALGVGPGEMLGIIGPNGAGKSTLLRLIGGVGRPTSGTIRTEGVIGSLLELGSDFHPELTGRENAMLSGIVAGLTRREVLARMSDIVEFAELRDFIDRPVRTYSSGMLLRLAFAIIANTNPDVLLIDEVLAVGDESFRTKCVKRIEDFRRRGCAILLVTHETRLAATMCDQVLWLQKGKTIRAGRADEVVTEYLSSSDWETKRRTPTDWHAEVTSGGVELQMLQNRFGSMQLRLTDVRLLNESGFRCRHIKRGEQLRVEIDFRADEPVPTPNFGVLIRQADNTVLFDETMPSSVIGLDAVRGVGSVALTFDRLDLNSGEYFIDVGVYRHDWAYAYDYHWRAYPLTVVAASQAKGAVNPPHVWAQSQPRPVKAT